MKRVTPVLLGLIALACADPPTAAPPTSLLPPPATPFSVTFQNNGQFYFDTSTDCAVSGLNIQCYLKVVNGGERTAVGLSVYGYWSADAVCLHTKTGKVAPAKHQPTVNPQQWTTNYYPSGGIAVSGGVAEVSSLTLAVSAVTAWNPCSLNKGPYTAVQWENITPTGWLAIAFDSSPGTGYATAQEQF